MIILKKYLKPRSLENVNKKLTFKNANDLLARRAWVINAFENERFPMRSVNDDHDDNGYIYVDELYFKGIPTTKTSETPRTLTTSPEILGPIPQHSTQETGIKILPPKPLLQRLPPLVAQVQSGNTSENLLNELRKLSIHFIGENDICNDLLISI